MQLTTQRKQDVGRELAATDWNDISTEMIEKFGVSRTGMEFMFHDHFVTLWLHYF